MLLDILSVDFVLIILALLLVGVYFFNKKDESNLPPGPPGWPIYGNVLQMAQAEDPSRLMRQMAKEYGPIMKLKLGSELAVVLSGYDQIKEALVDKAEFFSGRPQYGIYTKDDRQSGIIHDSTDFKERRRLALTSMRDFGLGKTSLDERIRDEAEILMKELEASNGKPVILHDIMPIVTTNIICTIIKGDRFPYDSEEMKVMIENFGSVVDISDFRNLASQVIPWPMKCSFMNKHTGLTRETNFNKLLEFVKDWVKEHMETFDEDNIRDLIDLFIQESRKNRDYFTEKNIMPVIFDLFVAGTETTSTTLLWSIAYLACHKDIQRLCQKEIHDVVGRGKIPEYKEAQKMPYLNAFMNEVQRMANIVPSNLFHSTQETVKLGGYTIPKGCTIIPNLESALKDEKYFGDPYSFRPERWLDSEGKLTKNQAQIPFSIGKRECLGMLLAKKEYFIFLASMLQNFDFALDEKSSPPNLQKGCGKVRTAPEYKVKVLKI